MPFYLIKRLLLLLIMMMFIQKIVRCFLVYQCFLKPNWLLFTAGAILPTNQELQTFGIETHKVIKIKASHSMTEKDIILKALAAKNASAIVASDNFSAQDKDTLRTQARQNGCEIFFMNNSIQQTLTRHLH